MTGKEAVVNTDGDRNAILNGFSRDYAKQFDQLETKLNQVPRSIGFHRL